MEWILIYFIASGYVGYSGMEQFETKQQCESVKEIIVKKDLEGFLARNIVECHKINKDEL